MSMMEDTGLIICVSGDGPRYDLHFHYDKSRFTKTEVEAIVKAGIEEAHALTRRAEENDTADFPVVNELLESWLSKIGIEAVRPLVAPVWDDQSIASEAQEGHVARTLVSLQLPELAQRLLDGAEPGGPAPAAPSPH